MRLTNNLNQVLSTLESIDTNECRDVMSDYDSFIHRIQQEIFIQTLISYFNHAENCYLKGNETGEKKSLSFAQNLINSENIKDQDLKTRNLRDYLTGLVLTSDIIAMRLRELRRDKK
jgi:hypothetical protein